MGLHGSFVFLNGEKVIIVRVVCMTQATTVVVLFSLFWSRSRYITASTVNSGA